MVPIERPLLYVLPSPHPHPRDRRATLATLTARGRETAAAATEALHAISFGAGALGHEQLDQLTAILLAIRLDAGDFAP